MSFGIEYLIETTQEDSVCHTFMAKASTLDAAQAEALTNAADAKIKGATGYQIRHLNAVDRVVSIENFSGSAVQR
ncbi:MAG: hypothetical protein M0D54_13465 [Hyphomonadaceae bacterium JAD_PAG50586_4]|nr:MAG: hypothetical protein M0D54_13465 [Hyphomonadaceae bacterium JAD_PAG50586_4]